MKIHSMPQNFETNKLSYLEFIFNCTDFKHDNQASENLKNKLNKIIIPRLNEQEKFEVSLLIAGITAESVNCVLRAIAELDCVKVELTK